MEMASAPVVPVVAPMEVESQLLPKPMTMTAASVHPINANNFVVQVKKQPKALAESKMHMYEEPPWTVEEDHKLRSSVQVHGKKNWKLIAMVHGETGTYNRTHTECMNRWNHVLRPGLIKGAWLEKEDKILKEAVIRLQTKNAKNPHWKCNWSKISLLVPGRTAKQCRERWRCNLDPHINKSDWSEEEDAVLLSMQCTIGNRWALIAKSLPGRTENAIKTRFRSIQRANKKRWTREEDAVILAMRAQKGCRWETIAEALPNRTKNGVKVRHRQLVLEQEAEDEELAKQNQKKGGLKRKSSAVSKSSESTSSTTKNQPKKESKPRKRKQKNVNSATTKKAKPVANSNSNATNTNFVSNAPQFVPAQPVLNPQNMQMTPAQQIAFANSQAALFKSTQLLIQNAAQLKPETIGHITPISTAPMNNNYSWKIQIDPKKEAENRQTAATTLVNMEQRAAATLLNMATSMPVPLMGKGNTNGKRLNLLKTLHS